MSTDVFVSYASKDRDRVLPLVQRLKALGVSVWIDRTGIDPSSLWFEAIVEAIERCKFVLFVASASSIASSNVVRELSLCLERDKPLLPVYLEQVEIPKKMKYFLTGVQYVELFGRSMDDGIIEIVQALKRHGVAVLDAPIRAVQDEEISLEQVLDRLGSAPVILPRVQLLDEAVRKLQQNSSPVLIIQGLAGIGKTVLMSRIARATCSAGNQILVIPLEGPSAVEPAYLLDEVNDFLNRLGRGLTPEQLIRDSPERVLAILGSRLADTSVRVLVLLDAIDDVIPTWLAAILRCLTKSPLVQIVATSRTRIQGLDSAHLVVPPLSDSEAIALVAEHCKLFQLDVDPKDLIGRLPPGIRSHPQALVTLLAQLADFPLEMILAWGLPEPVQTPARLVQQIIAVLLPAERQSLAFMQILSGLDLFQVAKRLNLRPAANFLATLKSLLSRSLLYRSEDGKYVVPALVAETLTALDETVVKESAEQIASALHQVVSASDADTVTADLADYCVRIVHNLVAAGQSSLVSSLIPEDFIEILNLRGMWKEYAVLLHLGLEAARRENDNNGIIRLGFRLTRKLIQTGDPEGARQLLGVVEPLIAGRETQQRGELHSHRAMIYQIDRDDAGAMRELCESRRIRMIVGDQTGLAVVEKLLGNLYLRRNDLASARQAFKSAFDLLADQPLAKHRLETAINLAVCDLLDGKVDAAEEALRRTLADCRTACYDAGLPRAQLNLALVLERQGRLTEAVEFVDLAARGAEGRDFAVAGSAAIVAVRLKSNIECATGLAEKQHE